LFTVVTKIVTCADKSKKGGKEMKSYQLGTFLLRLMLGLTFFIHGLGKFQSGIDNTVGFFHSMGIPAFFAYAVAVIEFVGGAAMILGFQTRLIGVLFAIVMIGAIFTAKSGAGFTGGYELEVSLFVVSLHMILAGSGAYALDNRLQKPEEHYS
jgi:putative oxidoreductase